MAVPGGEPGLGPCAREPAAAERRERSRRVAPRAAVREDPDRGEIPRVVHEELGRLPERLRAPMVLCYLEGMTHELAARQLRCPVGTVRSRLARARALLQEADRAPRDRRPRPRRWPPSLESSSRASVPSRRISQGP